MKTTTAFAFLSLALCCASAARAQTLTLDKTFNDPTPTFDGNGFGDFFGLSVALDENFVLIGAAADNTAGTNVGQAHLFNATTGAPLQTFDDPNSTSEDNFGNSVALDGNHALIGARFDDTGGTDVGQAHLFNASTGALLQTFDDPNSTTADNFGWSVAIDIDLGNHVLIGAPGDDTAGTDVGQAHLFNATTGALLLTFDDPNGTTGDKFGTSVAVEGNLVLIGAPFDDTAGGNVGQAHLFNATTGALLLTFDDPTITGGDFFGASVAIDLDGNRVLIGAPSDNTAGFAVGQAHLFDATTGLLLQTFDDPTVTTIDQFGTTVAIDGNRVLIGASLDDSTGFDVGQAHLFNASTGALLQTFNEPTLTSSDHLALQSPWKATASSSAQRETTRSGMRSGRCTCLFLSQVRCCSERWPALG